jgi:hypothetical protein
MIYRSQLLLIACLAVLAACKQPAEPLTAKQVLDKAYQQYDVKHACWIAQDADGVSACMKLDSEKLLHLASGDRLYVLAVGEMVDENGESDGGHNSNGFVGAFVAETIAGKTTLIASNPAFPSGAFGGAPIGWKLLQLGASDYWGWQNTWSDAHNGYSDDFYTILAPYGKGIKELAMMTSSYDDSGAIDPDACIQEAAGGTDNTDAMQCQQPSSIQSTLKIDNSNASARVYPLLITVSGTSEGVAFKPTTWKFVFDTKAWKYQEPKGYELLGKDF